MRHCVAFFFLLATVAVAQPDTLDFATAVQIARRQNIDLRQLQNQLELLRAQRAQAYASFLPEAALSADVYQISGLQFDQVAAQLFNTTSDQANARFNAQVDLFNGLGRMRQLQASRSQVMAQQQGIEQQRQRLVSLVAQQYLQVLLDGELAVIARRNLEEQREQLLLLEAYAEAGIRPITDLYNQRAEVKRLEVALIRADNQYHIDKAQLVQTLQLPPGQPFALTTPAQVARAAGPAGPDAPGNTPDVLYQVALAQRADVRQQQQNISAHQRLVQAQWSNYLPRLTAFFNYNSYYSSLSGVPNAENVVVPNPFNKQFFNENPRAIYGFSLTVPIFSRYQVRTTVVQARVRLQEQELALEQLQRTIFTNVQQALLSYQAARQRLGAAALSLEAAELAFAAQEERFRLGAGLLLEYNAARTARVNARAERAQAEFGDVFFKIMLDFETGQLKESGLE